MPFAEHLDVHLQRLAVEGDRLFQSVELRQGQPHVALGQ